MPAQVAHDTLKVGFQTFFVYYYLTTVATEVNLMWPRRWRWGKALFLVNRYFPMMSYAPNVLTGFRVHIILAPKACMINRIFQLAVYRVCNYSAEVALLLCLHALLGARPLYLTAIMATYLALTLGMNIMQIGYLLETSRIVPLSKFDRELGHACTSPGLLLSANVQKVAISGYISIAKAFCIFALALFIFLVRYRNQAGTCNLLHVLRRDSGIYILSLAAIRLSTGVVGAFRLKLGLLNIPDDILVELNGVAVPILANRLLLNMWRTQDPEVRKTVSSILFDPPHPGEDSEDDDEEFRDRPIEMVRYEGLGRRRALGREETVGTPQGGTGATQAAKNDEGV
ncbi:hypothetical protein DFP72DRAFT_1067435 [Ephemerocybe angulata]|uniref:DUF6533 domain-containing protein n=1 Tax=Ephemerocybe angulata TaxID=980116 RepID=A0A8H6M922_9AGAR|nr:hypothetical protein DFP72DRAFT_1067435 [Tulosesus angulatus]